MQKQNIESRLSAFEAAQSASGDDYWGALLRFATVDELTEAIAKLERGDLDAEKWFAALEAKLLDRCLSHKRFTPEVVAGYGDWLRENWLKLPRNERGDFLLDPERHALGTCVTELFFALKPDAQPREQAWAVELLRPWRVHR